MTPKFRFVRSILIVIFNNFKKLPKVRSGDLPAPQPQTKNRYIDKYVDWLCAAKAVATAVMMETTCSQSQVSLLKGLQQVHLPGRPLHKF